MTTQCPWIVINCKTGMYECQRCGVSVKPPSVAMSVGMLIGMMNGFRDEHKDCEPPACGTAHGSRPCLNDAH